MTQKQTLDDEVERAPSGEQAVPGAVLIFSGGAPVLRAVPMPRGRLVLGREDLCGAPADDERVSREHSEIKYEYGRFTVRDLGSKNGTYVAGREVSGEVIIDTTGDAKRRDPSDPACGREGTALVRLGSSLVLLLPDVSRFLGAGGVVESRGDTIIGPTLRAALARVLRAAGSGDSLLIHGESGVGKELAARQFAEAAGGGGPFIAVNCAAIPEGVAERLLFGAKKGAFSGATADVEGYVQSADGGTLFLDEVGELDAAVQAKLLRVLETHEVLPLGASRARAVSVRVCAATNRDLRGDVARGRFREDLYYRIGRPDVLLPPLRERREEIPWLVVRELSRVGRGTTGDAKRRDPSDPACGRGTTGDAKRRDPSDPACGRGLTAHGKLIEACCLRPWPGNVRELLREVRRAGLDAAADGEDTVRAEHLGPTAGLRFEAATAPEHVTAPSGKAPDLSREAVEAALAGAGGNVSATARTLGLHRTQMYRLMKRLGVPTPS